MTTRFDDYPVVEERDTETVGFVFCEFCQVVAKDDISEECPRCGTIFDTEIPADMFFIEAGISHR